MRDFFNLYRHGFARLAVATPLVRVGDPQYNLDATLELMRQAAREKAVLAVFPELGLSGYTCDDLFHQQALIDAAEDALFALMAKTKNLPLAALVGLPVAVDGLLYNCAALVSQGRLAGVVPKSYLPNYREFYEGRQFTPGDTARQSEIVLAGPPELLDGPLAQATVETLRTRTLAQFHDGVRVRMTEQGQDIVLRGAAVMVLSGQLGVS